MSLFQTVPTSGDFSPLFRLLDDYNVHNPSHESIDIEFSNHETLVIKGRSEHKFHPSDTPQGKGTDVTMMGDQFVTKANNNKHCYWLSEHAVGEFHRTFAFPSYVDQDEVKASLKDGILSLVVPKVTTSGTKKINTK